MDGDALCAKPVRGSPLIPPNYVSLRHLQELRLKEKEQQEERRRRREEEATVGGVKEEETATPARHPETKVSSDASCGAKEWPFRGQHERQRQRRREEEATVGRVKVEAAAAAPAREPETKASSDASCGAKERSFWGQQERRRRWEEDAAVGRVKEKEAVAAPGPETKAWSNTSCGVNGRPFGGLGGQPEWVAVAHRALPLPPGEGTSKKKDGAVEDRRGMKGSDAAACNLSQGGGGKAENKGKEKVSTGTKGEPGQLAEMITASWHGCKPEKKMEGKGKPSGGQSTASGKNGGPGEAASASPRRRVRPENKRKGKNGSGDRSTKTDTINAPAETAGASQPQGVKSENTGNKKPSAGRRLDVAPSGDSLDRKRAQPPPAAEGSSNRRSGDLPDRKRAQPPPAADVSSNQRSGSGHGATTREAKSEGLGGKQPVVEVKGTADRNSPALRTAVATGEAKSEGLRGKHQVVELKRAAERKLQVVSSSAWRHPGGRRENASPGQHGGVWVPKAAVASPSLSGVAGL